MGWLGDRWREIRGNALWDGIKWVIFGLFLFIKPVLTEAWRQPLNWNLNTISSLIGAALFVVAIVKFIRARKTYSVSRDSAPSDSIDRNLISTLVFGTEESQRRKEKELTDRRAERTRCFEDCVELLKNHPLGVLPIHALSQAKAYRLEHLEDLIWICDELVRCEHDHPFAGLEGYVPKNDWLAFLKWINYHPQYDAKTGPDYLWAADKWRQDHDYSLPDAALPLAPQGQSERGVVSPSVLPISTTGSEDHLQPRPWIVPESLKLKEPLTLADNRFFMNFELTLTNSGNSTAQKVYGSLRVSTMQTKILEKTWRNVEDDYRRDNQMRSSDHPFGYVIAPGQKVILPTGYGGPGAAEDLPSVAEVRGGAFFVLGYVEYIDQLGGIHYTRFSFIPDGDSVRPWDLSTFLPYAGYQEAN